jgi:hypothetical protein
MPAVAVQVRLTPGESVTSDLHSVLRIYDGGEILLYAGPVGIDVR